MAKHGNWKATIEAWPHSTGKGQEADQEAAGGRVQIFEFRADDARDAMAKAEMIARGMLTNPMVWQAPIRSIEFIQE